MKNCDIELIKKYNEKVEQLKLKENVQYISLAEIKGSFRDIKLAENLMKKILENVTLQNELIVRDMESK